MSSSDNEVSLSESDDESKKLLELLGYVYPYLF